MGNKYTILIYIKHRQGYSHKEFWRGNNFFKMIAKLILAKQTKTGLITVEWRPENSKEKTNV